MGSSGGQAMHTCLSKHLKNKSRHHLASARELSNVAEHCPQQLSPSSLHRLIPQSHLCLTINSISTLGSPPSGKNSTPKPVTNSRKTCSNSARRACGIMRSVLHDPRAAQRSSQLSRSCSRPWQQLLGICRAGRRQKEFPYLVSGDAHPVSILLELQGDANEGLHIAAGAHHLRKQRR